MITETQVRASETSRLLRVISEVSLAVFVGIITDDLHRVLVCTYSTISTQTIEFSFEHAFAAQSNFFFLRQRCESYIIFNTDSELILRHSQRQVLVNSQDLSRSCILRTQTITATYNQRSIFYTVETFLNVQIQRFAVSTRFFRTIQNSNTLYSLRNSSQEVFSRERTIQVYRNQTYFFTFACQIIDRFTSSFCYRTHSDDNPICILSSIIIEQSVFTTCNLADFVHVFFYNSRYCIIERIRRFSVLEEVIRILSHTTSYRFLRIQGTSTELSQSFLIDQRSQIFVIQFLDFLNFVRSTETIKEVNKWYTRFQCCQVSYTSQIHHFLNRTFAQHGETCLTARHDILMITKDT